MLRGLTAAGLDARLPALHACVRAFGWFLLGALVSTGEHNTCIILQLERLDLQPFRVSTVDQAAPLWRPLLLAAAHLRAPDQLFGVVRACVYMLGALAPNRHAHYLMVVRQTCNRLHRSVQMLVGSAEVRRNQIGFVGESGGDASSV